MFIKQPTSDNALVSLWERIDFARERLTNCVNQNHDTTAILYISSLIISPKVIFNGRELLKEISSLIALSPRQCICVVRTTAPSHFPGFIRPLQKQSIDFLRNQCYVILYTPRREFLNHAKFLVHYHVCFSERIVYHGKYFGSTNLTGKGLGNPRLRGNYEEFSTNRRIKSNLSRNDEFYLDEVLDLISYKASLYTDPQYLAKYVSDHQTSLATLIRQGRELPSNPDRRSHTEMLYETYVKSLIEYSQTFTLLSEIPGKNLTDDIIERLTSTRLPPNPFEIEMMSIDAEYNHLMIESLEFSRSDLLSLLKENMDAIENAFESIRKYYQPAIKEIRNYFDEKEAAFEKFLKEYNKVQVKDLERMIASIKEGWIS